MSAEEVARGTKIYRRTTYSAIDSRQPKLSTEGRSAVVSGAGQGIGAGIALSLARSGISALALLGRRPEPLQAVAKNIAELGGNTQVFVYSVDITSADAVNDAFGSFAKELGGAKIDILVANAGYMANLSTIADAAVSDWWLGFEINIKGNFNLIRGYAEYGNLEKDRGAVIHIGTASMHGPYMPEFSSYRASKSGATKMFEIFANEHPDLFVLQIHPGLIGGTEMHSKFSHLTEDFEFDDVSLSGDFTVWALSPEARFLRGRFVHANWDVDELKAMAPQLAQDREKYTIGLLGW